MSPLRSAAAAGRDLLYGVRSVRGGCVRAVGPRLSAEAGEPCPTGGRARSRARRIRPPARDRAIEQLSHTRGMAPTRFLARRGNRFRVVPGDEVVAFTFIDGVTQLITATEQLSMQPTLASLARRLDPAEFFQVSRSAIIRLDAVKEAKPFSDGTGEILLSNGQTMTVARRRWRAAARQARSVSPSNARSRW